MIRTPLAVVLAALALTLGGCAQEEPRSTPAVTDSSAPSASPAPESMSVARTQTLVLRAQRRFTSELNARRRDNGGTYPDRSSIMAAFDAVPHDRSVYLAGFTLNRPRTGISYCIHARNQKSSTAVADGRGAVAELTERDCGGDSDRLIVGPSH